MKDIFYATFGSLTCVFSHMEAKLRNLISGLAFKDDRIAASIFMDSSQLSENTNALRKLSRMHREEDAERMIEIVKRIEKLRPIRNLFIHGLWHHGNFEEDDGLAYVTDLRTTYEIEKSRSGKKWQHSKWQHSKTQSFSRKDFRVYFDEAVEICDLIDSMCEKFEEESDGYDFGNWTSVRTEIPNWRKS